MRHFSTLIRLLKPIRAIRKPGQIAAFSSKKMERYDEAAKAYRKALELNSNAVVCMHNLGMLCIYKLDKREEGLRWLKTTLKYDPQRWFKLPSELRSAVDQANYF